MATLSKIADMFLSLPAYLVSFSTKTYNWVIWNYFTHCWLTVSQPKCKLDEAGILFTLFVDVSPAAYKVENPEFHIKYFEF